jgi:hypothetical protein
MTIRKLERVYDRPPKDLLEQTLAEAETIEDILIISKSKDGNFYYCSSDMYRSEKFYMIEVVRMMLYREMFLEMDGPGQAC